MTFVVMLQESGLRDMMLSVGIMAGTVLVVGTLFKSIVDWILISIGDGEYAE